MLQQVHFLSQFEFLFLHKCIRFDQVLHSLIHFMRFSLRLHATLPEDDHVFHHQGILEVRLVIEHLLEREEQVAVLSLAVLQGHLEELDLLDQELDLALLRRRRCEF